ncbi:unnamed protein product [Darwinula stevensoni]|uniref:N-glycosylase/DNA lyase n=1 Tax=Darwinula stevensoni TaxID=69355 RepID=A0A7R8X6S1_9CRUS|nr:unnamed protein product [Darwinula stevensoni]CAG0888390.1 unnamed protein product [Darwinula stevensoni]
MPTRNWSKIACPAVELSLHKTLGSGQSFRWETLENNEWRGVLERFVILFSQTDTHLLFEVLNEHKCAPAKLEKKIQNYFQMEYNMQDLYRQWSLQDPNFAVIEKQFAGVRMLSQDPVENLFCFICSSNNNIKRISQMVDKMCCKYGDFIGRVDGKDYYSFPSIESLAEDDVEENLRQLGFGYRAKYVNQAAKMVLNKGGSKWLKSLRNLPYRKTHDELMKLPGVGAKVADCICLMSMGHTCAVPVDTHVFQIAAARYLPHIKGVKSLTSKVYWLIGDHFRNLFGDLAGWAHSVLFCADLKEFEGEAKQAACALKRTAEVQMPGPLVPHSHKKKRR